MLRYGEIRQLIYGFLFRIKCNERIYLHGQFHCAVTGQGLGRLGVDSGAGQVGYERMAQGVEVGYSAPCIFVGHAMQHCKRREERQNNKKAPGRLKRHL